STGRRRGDRGGLTVLRSRANWRRSRSVVIASNSEQERRRKPYRKPRRLEREQHRPDSSRQAHNFLTIAAPMPGGRTIGAASLPLSSAIGPYPVAWHEGERTHTARGSMFLDDVDFLRQDRQVPFVVALGLAANHDLRKLLHAE